MAQEAAPLVSRLADYAQQKWKLTPDEARARAARLLDQVGLDLGEALATFVQGNKPETKKQEAQWGDEYWAKDKYWEAMDSEAAAILKAVGATKEEIKALMRKQK